jgi:hypothetical protein
MLLALGAVSSALDALQSLTSSKSASPQSTGFGQSSTNPFDFSGSGPASGSSTPSWSSGGSQISPATMSALLAAQSNGAVSLDELSSALKGRGRHHHHDVAGGSTGADGSSSDPLLQALQGASSTSVTNSDGSTTTSVTYADGSKVTMTSSAAPTASSSTAASSYNIIERMIAREAQAIASAAPASLSVSV